MKKRIVIIVAALIVAGISACRADDSAAPAPVKTPAVAAKEAQAVIDLLNLKTENMKLRIELLQARRKIIEYEYSANCYKDRRWRDATAQIETITQQLEQLLIGAAQ